MNWDSSPAKVFFDNPMVSITDRVVIFCIAATLIIFDSLLTLISIFKKGIFVDQKALLMQKTNKELKAMLVGVKRITNLNKTQLVDLVLLNS
tara:strand:- start:23 stop:298 length:276 start_codon:yes stop_codon:yes gene_type:complete